MSVKVFEQDGLLVMKYSGAVLPSDAYTGYQQLVGLPGFDTAQVMVVDCEDVTAVVYEEADFFEHATLSKVAGASRRDRAMEVAVLVTNKDVLQPIFEVIKTAQQVNQNWTRHVFGDKCEAYDWARSKLS